MTDLPGTMNRAMRLGPRLAVLYHPCRIPFAHTSELFSNRRSPQHIRHFPAGAEPDEKEKARLKKKRARARARAKAEAESQARARAEAKSKRAQAKAEREALKQKELVAAQTGSDRTASLEKGTPGEKEFEPLPFSRKKSRQIETSKPDEIEDANDIPKPRPKARRATVVIDDDEDAEEAAALQRLKEIERRLEKAKIEPKPRKEPQIPSGASKDPSVRASLIPRPKWSKPPKEPVARAIRRSAAFATQSSTPESSSRKLPILPGSNPASRPPSPGAESSVRLRRRSSVEEVLSDTRREIATLGSISPAASQSELHADSIEEQPRTLTRSPAKKKDRISSGTPEKPGTSLLAASNLGKDAPRTPVPNKLHATNEKMRLKTGDRSVSRTPGKSTRALPGVSYPPGTADPNPNGTPDVPFSISEEGAASVPVGGVPLSVARDQAMRQRAETEKKRDMEIIKAQAEERRHGIGAEDSKVEKLDPATRLNMDKRTARKKNRKHFVAGISDFRERLKAGKVKMDSGTVKRNVVSGVSVYIRKRPLFAYEQQRGEFDVVSVTGKEVFVHNCKMHADMKRMLLTHIRFPCDRAFTATATNEEVYEEAAAHFVRTASEGGIATMFMYGQTGSGKTYTMGSIIETATKHLFELMGHREDPRVRLSFFELAGKRCSDLLGGSNGDPILLREGKDGSVQVVGGVRPEVSSAHELLKFIKIGYSRRATDATDVNATSSRSHAVCQMKLKGGGVLTLVDCAGSERNADSMYHNKQRRKEAAEINSSLHALKECIRCIMLKKQAVARSQADGSAAKHVHIPFRSSNLTKVYSHARFIFSSTLHVSPT